MASKKLLDMLRKNGIVHEDGTDLTDSEIKHYFDGVFKIAGIETVPAKNIEKKEEMEK